MKIISLSKKKFQELEKLKLSQDIFNTEGVMYDYNYKGQEKIIKFLYTLNGPTFANKLYTLEMLDNNREFLPSSFCIPDYICTVNSKIIGFTIPKINGINLSEILKSSNIDFKVQIYYLKRIGEILNQLHNIRKYTELKDIYLNDLHESNFIVDNKNRELRVIDLDSCKIGLNKPFAARFLTPFSLASEINKYKKNKDQTSPGYLIPDSNTDIYCYCITILNYLYGDKTGNFSIEEFYEYLNYLEYVKIDKNLLNCFSQLLNNCKNENPLNYLDTITSTQVGRAKKIVYNKVKK